MKSSIQTIIENFPKCCDAKSNKVAKENGKRFEIQCAKNYYLKIRVDGCLIPNTDRTKCDYLFIRNYPSKTNKMETEKETEFYFVELKGKNIDEAFEQIENTIKHIKTQIPFLTKEKILGFIVSSKVPKGGTDTTKLRQKFAKKYGRNLHIQNKEFKYMPQ
ncbi:hypothetical protein CKY20_05035 [Capnocytophaga canis]|uniref:Uncharacterized protein n=1 Tax=Capnocytophaga canis TaxID=1848903 RepID=A0A3A1YKW7_9FLAO|nr:hypothetical protein [Capnocytophaga canis]RIY36894.1 hypothetical protein CKY20_05035 [Capnocytophaga canis]